MDGFAHGRGPQMPHFAFGDPDLRAAGLEDGLQVSLSQE
jgi:hypothetical protein